MVRKFADPTACINPSKGGRFTFPPTPLPLWGVDFSGFAFNAPPRGLSPRLADPHGAKPNQVQKSPRMGFGVLCGELGFVI